jgi:hypothetical protein
VDASIQAEASTANGGNLLTARIKLLWFTDASCATPSGTANSVATSTALLQGSYSDFAISTAPPAGATHLKIRFEVRDDNGVSNDGDDYAIDDVAVFQP